MPSEPTITVIIQEDPPHPIDALIDSLLDSHARHTLAASLMDPMTLQDMASLITIRTCQALTHDLATALIAARQAAQG